jgi:uncharacterized OB-fold protein
MTAEDQRAQMDWAKGTPIMIGPWMLGLGDPSPETVGYWDGVAAGRLLLKRCRNCDRFNHPRRLFCLSCRSDNFEWSESSGRGCVYTFSTVHRAPTKEFQDEAPYTVGIIELDEGVFFCSRILSQDQTPVAIGAPVMLSFRTVASFGNLPVFDIVTSTAPSSVS